MGGAGQRPHPQTLMVINETKQEVNRKQNKQCPSSQFHDLQKKKLICLCRPIGEGHRKEEALNSRVQSEGSAAL